MGSWSLFLLDLEPAKQNWSKNDTKAKVQSKKKQKKNQKKENRHPPHAGCCPVLPPAPFCLVRVVVVCGFSAVSLGFSGFLYSFSRFLCGFSVVSLWFRCGFSVVSLGFSAVSLRF
jgi:hypothetical protein